MGAESYYVKLKIVETGISKTDFLSKINETKIKYAPKTKNEVVVDDFLILTVFSKDELVQWISIEGCFSWFQDCTLKMYEVISNINTIQKVNLQHKHGRFDEVTSKEFFMKFIKELYEAKYNDFVNRYGSMNVKCLPRESFYNYIKKKNKKSLFRKIFG